jgi:hypothetical protein
MIDPRAKQALYMARKSPKSSMGFGSGRALMFIIVSVAILGAAIWFFLSMR